MTLNNIYNLNLPIVIELKMGSKCYDRCAEFKEDIKKLLGYCLDKNFIGIAILFYQDEIETNLFEGWLNDTVDKLKLIEHNKIELKEASVNCFIITPSKYILTTSVCENI